jgi:hypothetical protein
MLQKAFGERRRVATGRTSSSKSPACCSVTNARRSAKRMRRDSLRLQPVRRGFLLIASRRRCNDEAANQRDNSSSGGSSGPAGRTRSSLYSTRNRGLIGVVSLLGGSRGTGNFLKLFFSQSLAYSLGLTKRFMNVFVG